jgi:hypothetical protein
VAAVRTHAQRLASRDGYFAPESLIRRVGNSPLTPFLGGGPAVLLQVAHPLVAVGVVQHSDCHGDLRRRLVRTLRALYLIAFGTKAEAECAGERSDAESQPEDKTEVAPAVRAAISGESNLSTPQAWRHLARHEATGVELFRKRAGALVRVRIVIGAHFVPLVSRHGFAQ